MSRPLLPEEKRILDAFVALDLPEADALRCQLAHTRVTGTCECGCGTLQLDVDWAVATPLPAAGGDRREASVYGEGGRLIGGLILHLEHGYVSALQAFSFRRMRMSDWPTNGVLRLEPHRD